MSSIGQVPGRPGYPASRPAASASTTAAAAAAATAAAASPSTAASAQQRQRNDESWVEVSSQPSSSSVSSIGEEIDTTGLRVVSSYHPRRRRQHQQPYAHANVAQATRQGRIGPGGSSQEEYDETESEEDHLLTSSTENVVGGQAVRPPPQQGPSVRVIDSDTSDDDDENATALGRRPSEPFRPQPNAFSHPPSHLLHRHSTGSAFSQHGRRPSFTRRSHTRADRHASNFMSPNYQADNDAALRASLTTLLSCAAAARSLPKDGEKEPLDRAGPVNSTQPVALRFAPESELMAPSPPLATSRGATRAAQARTTPSSPPEPVTDEKPKRTATPTPVSKSPRAAKKKKAVASEDTLISPTILTWVVGAGVVVLVSVVGFGAGYVIGREVGRQETLGGLGGAGNTSAAAEAGHCGREALKSSGGTLRRFRWGSGMGRSVVA